MNKHSIITAVSIVIIVSVFAYSGLNIIGAQQLEYSWSNPDKFSFFELSNSGEVKLCNNIPFFTSVQKFEVLTYYQGKHMGSFVTNSFTINPDSSKMQQGLFLSDTIAEAQRNFMTLDFMFNGGAERMDPDKFIIQIQIDTPIIGIIPYSSTTEMLGSEFDKIMNTEKSCN